MPLKLKRMREVIVARQRAATSETQSDNPVVAELETALKNDIASLKTMESIHHRAYAKREKFAKYRHYVSGIIQQERAINDPITRMMLVWASDAFLIEEFIKIATYMIKFDLSLPEGFKTSLSSFIADSARAMLTTESEQFKAINATDAERLNALIESIEDPERQPNDEAYAKFLKELGRKVEALGSQSALSRAKAYYEKAQTLNENVGVKNDLKRVEKALNS